MYRAIRDREPVLLPPSDVARANADGSLTVLILHYGQHPGPDHPRGLEILRYAHLAFRFTHEGFGVTRVIQEGYGEQVAFLRAGGMIVKADYAAHYAAHGGEPPTGLRPYLLGLDRTDKEAQLPGTTVSYLFQGGGPRLFFSPAEQRVLLTALVLDSDRDVAVQLGLSPNTLKKVWRSIYTRVERAQPSLLSPVTDASFAKDDVATRGREKRRVLLEYLRHHMSELRPMPKERRNGIAANGGDATGRPVGR